MPQRVMLNKLKLNGSMNTYKPSRSNTPKRCPFHYRGLECKSRKSRITWSNRQIWPWSTERSRAKANRVLTREHTGHSKHPLPTIQESTLHVDMTKWSIPKSDWFFAAKDGEALYSQGRRQWQSTPVFLPGESQGWGSLVGCHLLGHTETDTAEVT